MSFDRQARFVSNDGTSAMSATLYQACNALYSGETDNVLQCVSNHFEIVQEKNVGNWQSWLMVIAGGLIFFMQAGFAMLCAGCVRKKNVQNTMLKNLLDACGAALAFYALGYGFAFGGQDDSDGKSFIGNKNFFFMGDIDPAFWFFEYTFSATSVTIVAGTLAERCQMSAYLCYSIFLTGFVYPVVARAIWSTAGFLSAGAAEPFGNVGVFDFAGSGVVHLTGGTTALIAAYMLGARKGRFTDERGRPLDKPKEFPGHSIALQLMGTMVLWFGWYGFNPGSALLLTTPNTGQVAALVAVNTSLAAASGAIGALFTNLYLEERKTGDYSFNLTMAMNGLLSGLVAVTAPCGTIEPWAACLIGLIAGWVYISSSALLLQWRIDDAVDAIPVHMFNGAWGLIATGLFSSPSRTAAAFGTDKHVGWFYSLGQGSLDFQLLGNQIAAACFILAWTSITMAPFFMLLNYLGWLRADSLEELVGLDMSYHGKAHGPSSDDNEDVKDEDMRAFQRRKTTTTGIPRRRRSDDGKDEDDSWNNMSADMPPESARPRKEDSFMS